MQTTLSQIGIKKIDTDNLIHYELSSNKIIPYIRPKWLQTMYIYFVLHKVANKIKQYQKRNGWENTIDLHK